MFRRFLLCLSSGSRPAYVRDNLGKSQVYVYQVKRTVATLFSEGIKPGRVAIVRCRNHAVAAPDHRIPRRRLGPLDKATEGRNPV